MDGETRQANGAGTSVKIWRRSTGAVPMWSIAVAAGVDEAELDRLIRLAVDADRRIGALLAGVEESA